MSKKEALCMAAVSSMMIGAAVFFALDKTARNNVKDMVDDMTKKAEKEIKAMK